MQAPDTRYVSNDDAANAKRERPLLEQVRHDPPHWAGDMIQAWDEVTFHRRSPFIERSYWTEGGSVNVFRVVGTQHWDYQGKSWMEFLEKGERMGRNLEAHFDNPGYYLATERKRPMMYYITLDGLSYFVGSDGNHRTCIARFDFFYQGMTTIHGVTICHYQLDHAMIHLYEKLQEVCEERSTVSRVEPFSQGLRREDGPGWKIDYHRVGIRFVEMGEADRVLDHAGAEAKLRELSSPPRRRWFDLPWGKP